MSLAKTRPRKRTRSKPKDPAVVGLSMTDVDDLLGARLDLESVDLFLGLRDYVEPGPDHRHHVDVLIAAGIDALTKARAQLKVTRDLIYRQLRAPRRRRR